MHKRYLFMNTNYLRDFLVTARLKSFSRAAEELFISQSSLSKHIQSLEKELGVELFERNSRNVALSDVGLALLPHISSMMENEAKIHRLCEDKQRIMQSRSGQQSIYIASSPIISANGIIEFSSEFQKKYPDIKVQLEEFEPGVIPSMISSHQCELAFFRDTPSLQYRYDTIPMRNEKVLAVMPEKHPLSKKGTIQLSELKNEPLIFLSANSVLHGICMDLCLSAGFLPNVIFTGSRPENIIDLVSRGMGTALLTETFFNYYPKEHTVGVDISPTAITRMVLAHLKDQDLSWPAQLFWNFAAAEMTQGYPKDHSKKQL